MFLFKLFTKSIFDQIWDEGKSSEDMVDDPELNSKLNSTQDLVNRNKNKSKFLVKGGFLLGTIIFLMYIFLNGPLPFSSIQIDNQKFGTFGDIIGGLIGALWALAGVYLFYAAIYQTQVSIQISTHTFKQYKSEVEKYKEEIELQRIEITFARRVLESQKFENTFFRLSEYHDRILESIKIGDNKDISCINYILEKIENSDNELDNYIKLYNDYSYLLNHYYENIIQVLNYVRLFEFNAGNQKQDKDSDSTQKEKPAFREVMNGLSKQNYVDMFYSKLSKGEIKLIDLHKEINENLRQALKDWSKL